MDNERLVYGAYLDNRFSAISSGCEDYNTQITELSEQLSKLYPGSVDSIMTGEAATSISEYLNNTYPALFYDILAIISAEYANYLLYRNDYMNLDTELHFSYSQPQLATIRSIISNRNETLWDINSSVTGAIQAATDVEPGYIPFTGYSEDAFNTTLATVNTLNENINTIENTHYNNDFTDISELITSVKTTLQSLLQITRTCASDFTYVNTATEELQNSTMMAAQIFSVLNENSEAINQAAENSNNRYLAIRQENAEALNTFVNFTMFTVSAIFTVVTAGAASPLLVACVAGGTAGVTSVTNEISNQYVITGSWVPEKPMRVVARGAFGTITGAAFGFAGAKYISPVLNNWVGNIPGVSTLLGSSNVNVQFCGEMIVSITSEVGSGIINRYYIGILENLVFDHELNIDDVLSDTFSPDNMLQDVVNGAISGAVSDVDSETPTQRNPNSVEAVNADATNSVQSSSNSSTAAEVTHSQNTTVDTIDAAAHGSNTTTTVNSVNADVSSVQSSSNSSTAAEVTHSQNTTVDTIDVAAHGSNTTTTVNSVNADVSSVQSSTTTTTNAAEVVTTQTTTVNTVDASNHTTSTTTTVEAVGSTTVDSVNGQNN